jgi:hypothetical protein
MVGGTSPLPHPATRQDTQWAAGWGSGPVPENAPRRILNRWQSHPTDAHLPARIWPDRAFR